MCEVDWARHMISIVQMKETEVERFGSLTQGHKDSEWQNPA